MSILQIVLLVSLIIFIIGGLVSRHESKVCLKEAYDSYFTNEFNMMMSQAVIYDILNKILIILSIISGFWFLLFL